jgi:hypothetical protein
MQSWVGYELVKVLHVFGLQPQVRKDINEWSEDLFETFAYLSNKNNEEYKENALRVLDILFNKTDHNSYFAKLNFGSKKIQKPAQLHIALGSIKVVEATTMILLCTKRKRYKRGLEQIQKVLGDFIISKKPSPTNKH